MSFQAGTHPREALLSAHPHEAVSRLRPCFRYALWAGFGERVAVHFPAGSLRARFALGTLWSFVGAMISRGFMLAAYIVCARFLGRSGFGGLGMIQSTVGMFGTFAGLGLGLTATKFVATYRHQDRAKAGRILALSAIAAFLSGLLMAAALLLFSPLLSVTVLANPSLASPLAIGAGLVFFGAVNGAQTGALAGFEAFKTIARVNAWAGILSFPLIFFGVWRGGLSGAVWGFVAALAVNWYLNHRALRRECSHAGISYRFVGCQQEIDVLYMFSLPALLASIITGPALWACNTILVRQPAGYAQLGFYTAADRLHRVILFLPTSIWTMVLPMLSNLYGEGDGPRFWKVFRANVAVNVGIALVAGLAVATLAIPIMSIYGRSFRSGWPVLVVLALVSIPETLNTILGQPLVAAHYIWWRFAFDVLLVVLLLGLAWFLIPRWGALGLAIACGGAYAVTAAGLFLFLQRAPWSSA